MAKSLQLIYAVVLLFGAMAGGLAASGAAHAEEARFALVIGNDGYEVPVPTAANDAGLIADTLRAAGFDVSGARNLDYDTLTSALKEFADKIATAGPDAVVFIYLAGYGLQFDGENYFLPIGAHIGQPSDIPNVAIKLSDISAALSASPTKARIIVVDAARNNPSINPDRQLAGGLALVEPADGELLAFNATPGTVAPPESGPYGAYAAALAEMIRTGGLSLDTVFDRVRLRVNAATAGVVVPWDRSHVKAPFMFFDVAPNAPQPVAAEPPDLQTRPIRSFSPAEAFSAALARDSLQGYEEYLTAFPSSPYAHRVRAIVAARREALTWLRSRVANTPQAYWSYLQRYGHGPHAYDARRRLTALTAPIQAPADFTPFDYADLPPPPPPELAYFDRGSDFVMDDPDFGPPPPPAEEFLPPPPAWWEPPPPPPEAFAPYFLPTPRPFVAPAYLRRPGYVVPPPPPPLYVQPGPGATPAEIAAGAIAGAAAAVLFRLPRAVQKHAQDQDGIVPAKSPGRGAGQQPVVPGQPVPGARTVATPRHHRAPGASGPAATPTAAGQPQQPGAAAPGTQPVHGHKPVETTLPSGDALPTQPGVVTPATKPLHGHKPGETTLPSGAALPSGDALPTQPGVVTPATKRAHAHKPGEAPLPSGDALPTQQPGVVTPGTKPVHGHKPAETPAPSGDALPTQQPGVVTPATKPEHGHKSGETPAPSGDVLPTQPGVVKPATKPVHAHKPGETPSGDATLPSGATTPAVKPVRGPKPVPSAPAGAGVTPADETLQPATKKAQWPKPATAAPAHAAPKPSPEPSAAVAPKTTLFAKPVPAAAPTFKPAAAAPVRPPAPAAAIVRPPAPHPAPACGHPGQPACPR